MRRSRFATLIELLIGIGLVSVLLVALLSYYRQVTLLGLKLDAAREESFRERQLQGRLSQVLTRAVPPKEGKSFFFTTVEENSFSRGKSLVFSYDNGAVLNTDFVNEVLGRLYLDRQGRIVLLTWPKAVESQGYFEVPPMKKEVLLEGVSKLDFSFYYYLDTQELLENGQKLPPREFLSDWQVDYQRLPVWVEIHFWRDGDKANSLLYPLVQTGSNVKYGI